MPTPSFRPIFLTGPARSGTTLLAKMLSAHPEVMVASDPYFWFFRSFRNAAVAGAGGAVQAACDPEGPFQDYYFAPQATAVLDAIQAAALDVPVDKTAWDGSFDRRAARMHCECPDLTPLLPRMRGPDHKTLLDRGLAIIAAGRGAEGRRYVGFKEVWIIEFFAALARAYPEARFLVVTRDPRGVLGSYAALSAHDPSQAAHPPSILRHWRKQVAFLARYRKMPLFSGRLLPVSYEALVRDPLPLCRTLCDFLEVPFDPAMLDPERFRDRTGGRWRGNASDQTPVDGVSAAFTDRWRTRLGQDAIRLADAMCGDDMPLVGYAPTLEGEETRHQALVRGWLAWRDGAYSWRSDTGDPLADAGWECCRRALARMPDGGADRRLVRRAFLFEEVHQAVLDRRNLMLGEELHDERVYI